MFAKKSFFPVIHLTVLMTFTLQTISLVSSAVPLSSSNIGSVAQAQSASETPTSQQGKAQRANSKIITLILAAGREENPKRALELLAAAREELKKEGLSPEDSTRILTMIEELEKKKRALLSKNQQASSESTIDLLQPGRKTPLLSSSPSDSLDLQEHPSADTVNKDGMSAKDVEKTVSDDPAVRDILWEIGRGRLSRDVRNLDAIVKDRTGQTVAQIDSEQSELQAAAEKPGALLAFLDSMGILKLDVSKQNLQLKQEYEGVSLDILADKLISDAVKYSAGSGALRGALAQKGVLAEMGGLTAETAATLAINAKLVLRLADLYGIEMDDTQRTMVLNFVFLAFKVGLRYGVDSPATKALFAKFGEKIASMKGLKEAGGLGGWFKQFISNKAVQNVLTPETNAALAAATNSPAPKLAAGEEVAIKTAAAQKASKWSKAKAIFERLRGLQIMQILMQAGLSSAETEGVGQTAKYIFKNARLDSKRIHNENFRRFLMTPPGEGFTKLLVLSMNDGLPSLNGKKISATEAQIKAEFILNISRSARACAAEDHEKTKDRLSVYACNPNQNTARYERLKTEMLTFDEIPQEYVADLRAVAREHRLRMGELILQMQFLDGDRNPDEVQFFRTTVAKTLGVDTLDDLAYFDRLHAYIQEHGGLERSPKTPTGFAIRGTAPEVPYDMNRGYTTLEGPDAPAGQRYLTPPRPPVSPLKPDGGGANQIKDQK